MTVRCNAMLGASGMGPRCGMVSAQPVDEYELKCSTDGILPEASARGEAFEMLKDCLERVMDCLDGGAKPVKPFQVTALERRPNAQRSAAGATVPRGAWAAQARACQSAATLC